MCVCSLWLTKADLPVRTAKSGALLISSERKADSSTLPLNVLTEAVTELGVCWGSAGGLLGVASGIPHRFAPANETSALIPPQAVTRLTHRSCQGVIAEVQDQFKAPCEKSGGGPINTAALFPSKFQDSKDREKIALHIGVLKMLAMRLMIVFRLSSSRGERCQKYS